MCGRYELHSHPAAIALTFGLAQPPEIEAHYNITPMTDVPIVRINAEGRRELVRMRWGLVPRWANDPSIGQKLINARGETLADKPSFQMAYRRHRCLLPADGFYEWMPVPAGSGRVARKQPVRVGMKDGKLFALAGLYERWRKPDGEVLDTCVVVTSAANSLLANVHDRMPVIVAPEAFDRWLDPTNEDVADLIAPFPSEAMTFHPVSTRVNQVAHDDAALIEPIAVEVEPRPADEAPATRDPEQESLF